MNTESNTFVFLLKNDGEGLFEWLDKILTEYNLSTCLFYEEMFYFSICNVQRINRL